MMTVLAFLMLLAPGTVTAAAVTAQAAAAAAPASTVAAPASAAVPADVWKPLWVLVGTWRGTRTGGEGRATVVRDYESVLRNQHLQVTERVGSERSPWGMISYDAERGRFVLRRFVADGGESELVLDEPTGDSSTLVFTSPEPGPDGKQARLVLEPHGWNELTERVESGSATSGFSTVSETRLRRKR
jgi:hypothetical protein